MRRTWPAVAAILLAATFAPPATAYEFGNAAMGRGLAETWCRSCHLIGPDDTGTGRAPADVPPFAEIARSLDEARLRSLALWLTAPHGAMPDLSLSRAEIADILTYIESLAARD